MMVGMSDLRYGCFQLSSVAGFAPQSYNSNPPIQKRNPGKTWKARMR